MCYAIPGKVIELKGNIAVVDYFGEHKNVLNEFNNIKPGDYIYAQGGVLISTIPEKDALEILDFWKEQFFELKEVDKKLSENRNTNTSNASKQILNMLQKVNLNQQLSRDDMLKILNTTDHQELDLIYTTANNTRQKENGNACCVHGIIEFSNFCQQNCFYCGIRKDKNIERYRMSTEDIIKAADHAVNELGFKALVLQSGEDMFYTEKMLVDVVSKLRKLNILVFLSIGERSKDLYKKLYQAGARAVLLRFETSNKDLYQKLRPGKILGDRLDLIKYIKNLGYIVATGFIMGLPEETQDDVINNILLTKYLKPDMYSFGPLIPSKDTPLENTTKPNSDQVLKTIALSRFVDKDSKILVTTAFETIDKDARKTGLLSGASSIMLNVTPKRYSELYSIYDGKKRSATLKEDVNTTITLLKSIGRAPTDLGL